MSCIFMLGVSILSVCTPIGQRKIICCPVLLPCLILLISSLPLPAIPESKLLSSVEVKVCVTTHDFVLVFWGI